jgi:hypothetical protein
MHPLRQKHFRNTEGKIMPVAGAAYPFQRDTYMKQPTALRLAEALYAAPETGAMPDDIQAAADELVRLHEANQAMQRKFNQAIDFAITQGSLAGFFLRHWREGHTTEWPEFDAFIAKGEQA